MSIKYPVFIVWREEPLKTLSFSVSPYAARRNVAKQEPCRQWHFRVVTGEMDDFRR
jgi:hypothetical protein